MSERAMRIALEALKNAKRLWPVNHPASGLIEGIEEDARGTYDHITTAIEELALAMAESGAKRDTNDRDEEVGPFSNFPKDSHRWRDVGPWPWENTYRWGPYTYPAPLWRIT